MSSRKVDKGKMFSDDPKFYVIYREAGGSGFWSNVFHVLGHCIIAEQHNCIPIIDMENFPTLYNEYDIKETKNAWEYYFLPVSSYNLLEVYSSDDYMLCNGKFPYFIYDVLAEKPAVVEKLISKYLKPTPEIINKIDEFYKKNELVGKKILGVHFRGWEVKTAAEHPLPATVQQMIENIYYMLACYDIDKILLATEQKEYETFLKKEFGDRLVCTNYYRTHNKVNAYKLRSYPREKHMYKLGLEAMQDAMLLSRADYLIATAKPDSRLADGSNVSLAAQAINSRRYKDVRLIKNGLTHPAALPKKIIDKYRIGGIKEVIHAVRQQWSVGKV